MGRHLSIPANKKAQVVLSVLAGEAIATAASREGVSKQSVSRWRAEFVEGGKAALAAKKALTSSQEKQLEAKVTELTQALGEAAVEIRAMKKSPRTS